MDSTVENGGVDESARSTDVFYALALHGPRGLLILTREDSGMRFAELSCDPTIAICSRKNSIADIRDKEAVVKHTSLGYLIFLFGCIILHSNYYY